MFLEHTWDVREERGGERETEGREGECTEGEGARGVQAKGDTARGRTAPVSLWCTGVERGTRDV